MSLVSKAFYRKVRAKRDKFLGKSKSLFDEADVLLKRLGQLSAEELQELLAEGAAEVLEQIIKLQGKLDDLTAKLGGGA